MTSFNDVAQHFSDLHKNWVKACQAIDPSATVQFDNLNTDKHSNHVCAISNGQLIEKAAIHFSSLEGKQLPPAATDKFPDYHHRRFQVTGMSLIIHPLNPHAPTVHANCRFFYIPADQEQSCLWWFGGGADLTPHFVYEADALMWHTALREVCDSLEENIHSQLKSWCDDYFYLPHRNETRGIGGIFFDYLNNHPIDRCLTFCSQLLAVTKHCYLDILANRHNSPFSQSDIDFKRLRHGRYAEFNLLYDRGTRFGLQYGSRTDSVLNSMPPHASWAYGITHHSQKQLQPYLVKNYPWLETEKSSSTET